MDFSLCRLSGECVHECVSGALIIGREISVEEVIYEVKKDMDYYKNTHGGMTLSGGEPMSQFNFSLEIFKAAKEHGISTCLDTCGHAGREQYEEILPYTDIFLFDYKESDSKKHRDYTGVSNEIILSNLEFLCAEKCYVILRCPIIPGLNDYAGHFKEIAAIGKKYPAIAQIEIITYHNIGREKAEQIGKKSCDVPSGTVDKETGEKWAALVRSYGCFISYKI
jgi:pyruvate formate lyase activating enzyme